MIFSPPLLLPLLSPPPPPFPPLKCHFLHTLIYTSPKVLTKRICLTIRSFLSWWSFPIFLRSKCLIQGWHCKEKIEVCHSQGVKGLIFKSILWLLHLIKSSGPDVILITQHWCWSIMPCSRQCNKKSQHSFLLCCICLFCAVKFNGTAWGLC